MYISVALIKAWGSPGRVMEIIPSLKGSHEQLLHSNFPNQNILLIFKTTEGDEFKVIKRDSDVTLNKYMGSYRLERYIGVVYCPQSERLSHYSSSSLSSQFDAIVFMDKTHAVQEIIREE